MRHLVLIVAATLALSQAAHADPGGLDPESQSRIELAKRLTDDHHDAIVLRNVGIGLTALGVIATVAGTVLYATNLNNTFCDDACTLPTSQQRNLNGGMGLLIAGQAVAVAGISMWATGGVRAGKTDKVQLSLGPTGAQIRF